MTHILNLIVGDRRNPTSELSLNQLTTGEIRLKQGSPVPNPGRLNVLYSGTSIRFDGEVPVGESRENMVLDLEYNIQGGSSADVSRIQREIEQFFRDAKLYNQDGVGEQVWLEYRWNTNSDLDNLPRPAWGQLNYYAEILSVGTQWPDNVYELVTSNFVEGVIATLTCKPHWYGLEQQCISTPGLMDVTDQPNTTLSFSGLNLTGNFAITGWFKTTDALVATNQGFAYYIDSSNYLRVYQATNQYVTLESRVSGTSTFKSVLGNTTSPNHFVVVQSGSSVAFYVNSTAASGSITAHAWSGGTLYIGSYTALATETTTTLDGWRFFCGDTLSAVEVAGIYSEEAAIKSAGGWVGRPPYQYTYNATNKVFRGNSTNSGGYNTAIIGNVNGSGCTALANYKLTANTGSRFLDLYMGRAIIDSPTIAGIGMYNIESPGSQTANNDSYDNNYIAEATWAAGGGNSQTYYTDVTNATVYDGSYIALARIKSDGDAITARLNYKQTTYGHNNWLDSVTMADNTSFTLVNLGELVIKKPAEGVPSTYTFQLELNQGSGETDVAVDFLQLVPEPAIRITRYSSNTSSFYVYIHKKSGTYGATEDFTIKGPDDGVTLEPNKKNVLMFQFSATDGTLALDSNYVEITTLEIIPRWTMAGGLIA